MDMAATEKGDGNEHVNVAENVAFADTMSVLIGIVSYSTNQPFMRLWEWQLSSTPSQVTNVKHCDD